MPTALHRRRRRGRYLWHRRPIQFRFRVRHRQRHAHHPGRLADQHQSLGQGQHHVRDSLAAGGEEFAVVTTPGNGVELQSQSTDGGATNYTKVLGGTNVIPSWLEIIRTGNSFAAFYSTQTNTNPSGVTWTQIGAAQSIAMPTTADAGLAVTAHNNSTLSTATFGNFTLTAGTSTTTTTTTTTPVTFSDLDIGAPGKAGSASSNGGVFTVSGGGADIYGSADQFNFDSASVTGNATLVTQVDSQPQPMSGPNPA